jgi:hypothetical protein
MSIDTSCTTALSALVVDRQRCCSAQYVASIAFQMARNPRNTASAPLRQARSPIHYPQSLDPDALTASATRPTAIKSP